MTTINPESLESAQVYPDRFGHKPSSDEYSRFYCQQCDTLLPEGATEDDEICKRCRGEGYQNPVSRAEYYLDALKTARGLPCICGLCKQIIDEEIKTAEKAI